MHDPHDPNLTIDIPSVPADSLDAGLAAGFGKPPQGPRSSLADMRPVLLKEAEGESAHVVKPKSDAMPTPEQSGDRYQLQGEIARGGMGAVLRGRDVDLGRDLAVKVLLEQYADRPEVARRFIEEAQIGGQLQHPGVVPVYDIGRFGKRPFFTMKLVKGQTLAALLGERADPALDRPRFLAIALQVAQTIAYAHAKGVIHRDLKPANIMVGAFGEVQVMDWGLAKVLAEGGVADEEKASRERERPEDVTTIRTARSSGSTRSFGTDTEAGSLLGTPAYMPPEQANGDVANLDRRADVFGLGAILCEILTGKPPYVGRSSEEVRRKAANGDLAEATARLEACGADPELVALTKACLSPEATDRPKDAQAVADGLTAYLDGVQEKLRMAELAEAEARTKAAEEAKRRRLTLVLAATVLLALSLAGGGGLWYQRHVSAQREEAARLEAELREGVAAALDKVTDLRQRARWGEARAVLEQVRQRLESSGPDVLRRQVEQAQADLALVDRLDAARLKKTVWVGSHFDNASAVQEYVTAFREAGLGDETEPPEVVAQRIRASAVQEQLVAALDDAWLVSVGEPQRRAWWLAVARAADPDPWRNRLRNTEVWMNRSAVERLAREAKVRELSPQILTDLGAMLKERGADAVPLLTAAQRHYPNDFWLSFSLAQVLRDAKRWDEAIGYYRAALAVRPAATAVYNNIGRALHAKGCVEEAIAEYQKAIEIDPKFAPARVNLGQILSNDKHDYDGAIAYYKKALELDFDDAVAHFDLGIALKGKGQLEDALAEYQKAIALDPRLADPHGGLGAILYLKHDYDGAIAEFQQAIKLAPEDAKGYHSLGLALNRKGRVDEAVIEFKKAIALEPKLANPHYDLGVILCDVKHDFDGAIACFRTAIDLDPKNAQAHGNLGTALFNKGQLDEAIRCCRQALELDPKQVYAHNTLGTALAGKGQLDEAIACWRRATELDPKYGMARANLGTALTRKGTALAHKGQMNEAVARFHEAIAVNPSNTAAHGNLGDALSSKGQLDAAIACYRKVIEIDPKDAMAHYRLGLGLKHKGRLDEAIASYKKAIEVRSDYPEAYCELGQALHLHGRFAESLAAYKRGHELGMTQPGWRYPSAQWVREAEWMVAMESKLAAFLKGEFQPKDTAERLGLIGVCQGKNLWAAAARLYADAFAADPKLADDPKSNHRYNAACSAARAVVGQSDDAAQLDDKEKARLRQQALDWLRADLALRTKELESGQPADRTAAQKALRHWQQDSDLAGIRDAAALAKLPAEERAAWEKLWADVAALLKKADTPAKKDAK
jgi:serine/threonine-protein kinase